MTPLTIPNFSARQRPVAPLRGLALLVGALAWIAAAAVGAVLALVFAATAVVMVAMASLLLTLAGAATKMRGVRRIGPAGILEGRRVGGHSWVAYGWDGEL